MQSFNNFYNALPVEAQRLFKKKVRKACNWNVDQFYKKMKGVTKIRPLESEKIEPIIRQFEPIYNVAVAFEKEVDEVLLKYIEEDENTDKTPDGNRNS